MVDRKKQIRTTGLWASFQLIKKHSWLSSNFGTKTILVEK